MPQGLDLDALARQFGGVSTSGHTPRSPDAASALDYDALAQQFGSEATPAMNFAIVNGRKVAVDDDESILGSIRDFGSEALAGINPIAIGRALTSAFWHPIETAKGVLAAQDQVRVAAQDAFKKGDYVTGATKFAEWMIPLLGPRMSEAGDLLQAGETARGLGAAVDVGLQVAAPTVVKNLPAMRVPVGMRPRNPVMAEAVAYGERAGVPLDAATATGSRYIQIAQKRASESMGGADIAEAFKLRQADKLAQVGEELAERAYPQGLVTPEQAGAAMRQGVRAKVQQFKTEADQAYGTLRELEAKAPAQTRATSPGAPFQSMKLAVDVRPVKAAMTSIYDQLKREAELTPLQGGKARALVTLDRVMSGPDFAPLSVADAALSDLKSLARVSSGGGHVGGGAVPDVLKRTAGQGIAAVAVTNLEQAVTKTAMNAGLKVYNALKTGRMATKAKYQAIDVLDKIAEEPVKAFQSATWQKDAGIGQLRKVAALAPDVMPQVGRAYVDDLIATATKEGGFGHADALFSKWQKLGPETKHLLFPDAGHVKALDNFFQLAKMIARNPNPSGTAASMHAFNVSVSAITYPLAKLFYSPAGVRMLTKGLRIPSGNTAARAAWAAEVSRFVGESMVPAPMSAVADREDTATVPR